MITMKNFKIIFPSGEKTRGEAVILVHGLFERGFWMYPMARFLSRQGYTVCVYTYRTTRARLAEHVKLFARELQELINELPDRKLHFAGHSMGGLMIRGVLQFVEIPAERRGMIFFMGVPHKGSPTANKVRKLLFFADRLVKVLPDLDSDPPADSLQLPEVPPMKFISIIARRDEVVPPRSSCMPGAFAKALINTGHMHLIFHKKVFQELQKNLTGNAL